MSIVNVSGKSFAFGEKANNNSVNTAKLYGSYDSKSRTVNANDVVDRRAITYYSNMTAEETNNFFGDALQLTSTTPEGWNGVIVPDGAGNSDYYMLLSNFASDQKCTLTNICNKAGKPVFSTETTITKDGSTATFAVEENHSVVNTLKFFINGEGVTAVQAQNDSTVIYVRNDVKGQNTIGVTAVDGNKALSKEVELSTKVLKISIRGGELLVEEAAGFPENKEEDLTTGYTDITKEKLVNASFEQDETYGKADGNVTLGSVTYNPCYVNTVDAANPKWPNILPVQGWTAASQLTGGSNFCRMYSMPYSATMYCVSPSDVGNYSDRCSHPVTDADCGLRTLTVLNSWDKGANAITQDATLGKGKYRLLIDARYLCPNETQNDGKRVTTSSGNINTSLTGIKIGTTADYRYPSQRGAWQQLCYDFELTAEQTVTISLGFSTSESQGAANNTLLYVDNVRLLAKKAAPGDVNNDGVVNIVDVTSTISYILGQNPDIFWFEAADVNGDNEINIVDVTSIIDMILGGDSIQQ